MRFLISLALAIVAAVLLARWAVDLLNRTRDQLLKDPAAAVEYR